MILREGTERAAGSPAGPRALRGRRSKKIAPIADRGSKVTAVGHRSFPLFACDGTSTPPTRLHGTGKMISIAPMIMPPPDKSISYTLKFSHIYGCRYNLLPFRITTLSFIAPFKLEKICGSI